MQLALVAILVPSYEEGLAFFVGGLGFDLIEDSDHGGGKRWVRVAPRGAETQFLLARAVGEQRGFIGQQGGGRVWLFLHSADFDRDHDRLLRAGATFEEAPRHEAYGTVAVFRDPFGHRWDLIEPAAKACTTCQFYQDEEIPTVISVSGPKHGTMAHFDGTALSGTEKFIPPRLMDFLLRLEATETTDEVWTLIVSLAQGLDLTVVDYVYATDFRNWEQAQFIRTTIDSRWFDYLRQFPHIRHTSAFRIHGCRYLTPIMVGEEYLDEMGEISEDRRRHVRLGAEIGLRAGIAIPLRMGDPGQAALIGLGGDFSRAEFDALLETHGWTIHAAMLSAHTRYTELFKLEFIERNQLTDKQKELLQLVGQGLMDKQIAYELGISFSAVRQRLATVQQKTGAQNRADLAALAARVGLVSDPLLRAHSDDLTVFLCTGDGKTGTEVRRPGTSPHAAAE